MIYCHHTDIHSMCMRRDGANCGTEPVRATGWHKKKEEKLQISRPKEKQGILQLLTTCTTFKGGGTKCNC